MPQLHQARTDKEQASMSLFFTSYDAFLLNILNNNHCHTDSVKVWSFSVPQSLFGICKHLSLISEGSEATVAGPGPLLCHPDVRCGGLESVRYPI